MRKFISIFLILFVCFSMFTTQAEAKRFGGGRSFGVSRSSSAFSSARPISSPMQNAASPNRNRWLGPLAGLAAGGLLASLFMGNGIANGMMTWLLVGAVIMLLLNLLRSFSRQNAPSNNAHNMFRENSAQNTSSAQWFNQSAAPINSRTYPANFDEADFLRKAKVQFIRLQAAYDQKNLQDLRQFTSPDVFAEIKMQFQERGNQDNVTDVVSLNAELLDASCEYKDMVTSVKFTGMIKEEANASANAFTEIWHFRKTPESEQWVTEGIQQA